MISDITNIYNLFRAFCRYKLYLYSIFGRKICLFKVQPITWHYVSVTLPHGVHVDSRSQVQPEPTSWCFAHLYLIYLASKENLRCTTFPIIQYFPTLPRSLDLESPSSQDIPWSPHHAHGYFVHRNFLHLVSLHESHSTNDLCVFPHFQVIFSPSDKSNVYASVHSCQTQIHGPQITHPPASTSGSANIYAMH